MQDKSKYIAQAKLGDETAIRWLIKDCQDRLYRYIFRMVRNEYDAQDLTQETLISIFKNIHKLKKIEAYESWIYQIAYRAVLKHSRKKKQQQFIEFSENFMNGVNDKRNNEKETFMCKRQRIDILKYLRFFDFNFKFCWKFA